MKKQNRFLGRLLPALALIAALSVSGMAALAESKKPDAGDFSSVGAASAEKVSNGVKFKGDWGAKISYSQRVKVDGFSITLGNFAIDSNFGSLAFVLSPNEGGVDLGSTGDGFMIKIWNFGSTYMDAAPTSISGWNDLQLSAGGILKDAWLCAVVPDNSITINFKKSDDGKKYSITNDMNPTNANFSVDASVLEKAMNSDGTAYLTFYCWNKTTVDNSFTVQSISSDSFSTDAPPTTRVPDPTTSVSTTAPTTMMTSGETTATTTSCTETTTVPTTTASSSDDTTGSGWMILFIVAAVLMAGGCGVGIYILIRRKKQG